MRFAVDGLCILLCIKRSKKKLRFDNAGAADIDRGWWSDNIDFLNNQFRGDARDRFCNPVSANNPNHA